VPVLLAPLVGIALGALYAWFARSELARLEGPTIASRSFALIAAFAVLVYTPIAGYFVAFHGDWAYLYLVSVRQLASAVDLALVLLSGASIPLGFLGVARWARTERIGPVAIIGSVPAAAALVLAVVFQKRLATSATFSHFHGDFGTEPITSSQLGRGVLFMGLMGLAGAAWCAYQMRNAVAKPKAASSTRWRNEKS
jgi:hypothetical protein